MAMERLDGRPLRQVASYVSSGTFTTPPGVNQLWVSVLGAAGSRSDGDNSEAGGGKQIAAYVNTAPGQTHPVIIGARGTRGQAHSRYSGATPTQSGVTSFDAALIASGGGIGGGTVGTVKAETTVLPLAPAGAIARVTTPTTGGIENTTGDGTYTHNNGNGMVWIYV
jgi:hypothetical protein